MKKSFLKTIVVNHSKFQQNPQIFAMAVILERRAIAVLKMPGSQSDRVNKCTDVVTDSGASTYFVPGDFTTPLADIQTSINLYNTDNAGVRNKTVTKEQRDDDYADMVTNMNQLVRDVQTKADADRLHASAIIASTGLSVKMVVVRTEQKWELKHGESGEILLTIPAPNQQYAVEWNYSSNQTTWEHWMTLRAETSASELTVGTRYYFRYRVILREGTTGWSTILNILVN